MARRLAWFEIPVTDMDRAKVFYEDVFNIEINVHDFGGVLMGWFPQTESEIAASGSLIKQSSYVPSKEGTLIYFACEDVATEIGKVEKAGGKVYQKKTKISEEYGYMAVFVDTEGNRIALHSQK